MNFAMPLPKFEFDDKILDQGAEISRRLNQLRMEKFPPNAKKTLRQFSMAEVAHYLGVTQNNLKRLHLEGKGPEPAQASSGRRSYTAEQMLELRHYLDRNGRTEVKNTFRIARLATSCRLSQLLTSRVVPARPRRQLIWRNISR